MRKILLVISFGFFLAGYAQETVLPAKEQTQEIVLYNGTIHTGNGEVEMCIRDRCKSVLDKPPQSDGLWIK